MYINNGLNQADKQLTTVHIFIIKSSGMQLLSENKKNYREVIFGHFLGQKTFDFGVGVMYFTKVL